MGGRGFRSVSRRGGDEERMERKGCTDRGPGEIKMKNGRRD